MRSIGMDASEKGVVAGDHAFESLIPLLYRRFERLLRLFRLLCRHTRRCLPRRFARGIAWNHGVRAPPTGMSSYGRLLLSELRLSELRLERFNVLLQRVFDAILQRSEGLR